MMKQLVQRQQSKGGTASPLNIHDLTSIDSDSDLSDDQVVMLSWNNGKVITRFLNFAKSSDE